MPESLSRGKRRMLRLGVTKAKRELFRRELTVLEQLQLTQHGNWRAD